MTGFRQYEPVVVDPEEVRNYFRDNGFDLSLEERDLHAEHVIAGEPGRASFFVEGRLYWCVALRRDGRTVARRYAHGETVEAALAEAKRRFGSEQA